jgi:hypothetical protein
VTLETSLKNNPSGTWCFTVTDVQKSGYTFNTSTGVLSACEEWLKSAHPIPGSLALSAFPNPFNPSTTITFTLPADGTVRAAVYDALGRRCVQLLDGTMTAGTHYTMFDAAGLPSGNYLIRLDWNGRSITKTCTLMK